MNGIPRLGYKWLSDKELIEWWRTLYSWYQYIYGIPNVEDELKELIVVNVYEVYKFWMKKRSNNLEEFLFGSLLAFRVVMKFITDIISHTIILPSSILPRLIVRKYGALKISSMMNRLEQLFFKRIKMNFYNLDITYIYLLRLPENEHNKLNQQGTEILNKFFGTILEHPEFLDYSPKKKVDALKAILNSTPDQYLQLRSLVCFL